MVLPKPQSRAVASRSVRRAYMVVECLWLFPVFLMCLVGGLFQVVVDGPVVGTPAGLYVASGKDAVIRGVEVFHGPRFESPDEALTEGLGLDYVRVGLRREGQPRTRAKV